MTLLIIQLGWAGFLGIMTILVIVPIAACVSKRKGVNIEKANTFKDKRVEMITEVINGIKFIKLYG